MNTVFEIMKTNLDFCDDVIHHHLFLTIPQDDHVVLVLIVTTHTVVLVLTLPHLIHYNLRP